MCDVQTLNKTLVKEAESYTGISDSKEAVETVLRSYFENVNRKKILEFQNSNVWQGDLNEMRESR